MSAIRINSATKVYARGVRAVDAIDLTIDSGEFVVLVGPSGCGKSTLLRMIAGLEDVTEGSIEIGGVDVTYLSPAARDVAMVFQNYALYPHMTVRANLGYGLRVRRESKVEIHRRVGDVARMLGLHEYLDRRPFELSGGQRQRVAMGRAIARKPAAYLMDEPLSNLDAKLRVAMRGELASLHAALGVTTVYVTHDQVEAMTLGHRIAVMHRGRVQQYDAPSVIYNDPSNLFVASFIGSPAMNLVRTTVTNGQVEFGGFCIPLNEQRRPASDGDVILGLRPEAFEDAELAHSSGVGIDVNVAVAEQLGAESHLIFPVDAPRVDVEAIRDAFEGEESAQLLADESRAIFTARVDARSTARRGDRHKLFVDPSKLYFFDPISGVNLINAEPRVATTTRL